MRLCAASRPVSSAALAEARQALTSWAVNHPYNPGTLPMPDRNGDGNYDGDADCFNGVINNNLLLGMLPRVPIPAIVVRMAGWWESLRQASPRHEVDERRRAFA